MVFCLFILISLFCVSCGGILVSMFGFLIVGAEALPVLEFQFLNALGQPVQLGSLHVGRGVDLGGPEVEVKLTLSYCF